MIARILTTLALVLAGTVARAEIDIIEITSDGGIDAWVVEEPSIPFLALEIRFRGGATLDREGMRGAVNLMTGLIEEGAGELDAQAFQTAREALAARFGFRAYDDTLSISAQMLTENREEALDLLRQALTQPRFDEVALERVRAQVLAGIESDQKNPSALGGQAFNGMAFEGHPYGTDISGTLESVAGLTRDDMVQAHRDALTLDRVYVSVVGDITADEVGPMLDELLGSLPAEGPPLPENVAFGLDGGITVVDYDTPQSVAVFGHAGIKREDEDFFAAYIMNHVLGAGSFESRLMNEVREKRGLTYGIRTFLLPKFHAEMMLGTVASANGTIAEAVEVIRDEWTKMAEEGLTAEELEEAKTYLTGEYPLRFDGNAEIAGIMVGMQMIDLPPEYVVNRNDYIEAVTLEDVNRVAAELLDPEGLHFVVVGKPAGLETGPF